MENKKEIYINSTIGSSRIAILENNLLSDIYVELPEGGAIFSTGSITFCGSLPSNNFDNNVSRLLVNVLEKFLRS